MGVDVVGDIATVEGPSRAELTIDDEKNGPQKLLASWKDKGVLHLTTSETGERAIDARTDQYSLGALAYEMLTGEPPHTGATAQVIIARLMTETPRSIRSARPAVSDATDAAVQRALSKSPADRFSTCSAFSKVLADSTTSATRAGVSPLVPQRSSPRNALVLAAAVIVAGALAFAIGVPRVAAVRWG
jgi:serine/threonine-protein kinase